MEMDQLMGFELCGTKPEHSVLFSVLALPCHHTCAGCGTSWWHLGGFPAQEVWLTWSKLSPLLGRSLGTKLHWVGLLMGCSDQEEAVAGLGVGQMALGRTCGQHVKLQGTV